MSSDARMRARLPVDEVIPVREVMSTGDLRRSESPPRDSSPAAGLSLLGADEPGPAVVEHPEGGSDLLLVCDHAGRAVPRALGRLGLAEAEFERHIAWDIGALAVSRLIARALDATLVAQTYSRLVIDCNRPLEAESSIPVISEATRVPGNEGLSGPERAARVEAIFRPYHETIAAILDRRIAARRPTVLIAMHSFTPRYKGESRPWHIGTLYGTDRRLGAALYRLLAGEAGLVVGDNEPYSVTAASDQTIPVHGEARGLLHVGIEIRQDLVADAAGQAEWGERLARLLPQAARVAGG